MQRPKLPDDARYKQFVGKEFDAVFAGEPIHLKVIADPAVEKEFGTGALGVTPAHSHIDWEMAQKHDLPLKQVINEYARMTVGAEGVKEKKVAEAREAVVAWLKSEGLLEKEEDIEHNISLAERTGGVVEPLPKLQWFVAVNKPFARTGKDDKNLVTLKGLMKEAVDGGIGGSKPVQVIPDRFLKVYLNWIDNLRDWCISRQIWYGHRVPVWYRFVTPAKAGVLEEVQQDSRFRGNDKQEVFCGIEPPKGDGWVQDEDTLDTWFSSGLWTFSTLGWPDEKEFKAHREYHPTTILETGSDILFFWVARMILMSTYLLNEVPFKTVYLHGLVRDTKNRKISKSLGNNIDPLDMIAKSGADAVRMSLIVGVGPGNDSKIDEQKIKAYKLFSNKLWNVARFILSSADGERGKDQQKAKPIIFDPSFDKWTTIDSAHKNDLNDLIKEITKEMDEYKFYLVSEKLYHYVWHSLADNILEESKTILASASGEKNSESRIQLLLLILRTMLKVLHPFMPYITEEIWGDIPRQDSGKGKSLLMVEEWPISVQG